MFLLRPTISFAATRCNTLQHTAIHYNTLQPTSGAQISHLMFLLRWHCHLLQRTATHCNTLQHTVTYIRCANSSLMWPLPCRQQHLHKWRRVRTLQHAATRCNTLQYTAIHCNAQHHATTHCNTLRQVRKCQFEVASAASTSAFAEMTAC